MVTEGRTVWYLFREKKREQRNLTTPESLTEIRVFMGEIIAGKLYYIMIWFLFGEKINSVFVAKYIKLFDCLNLNKKYNTKTVDDKHKKQ